MIGKLAKSVSYTVIPNYVEDHSVRKRKLLVFFENLKKGKLQAEMMVTGILADS
jgi:hypothetical protein